MRNCGKFQYINILYYIYIPLFLVKPHCRYYYSRLHHVPLVHSPQSLRYPRSCFAHVQKQGKTSLFICISFRYTVEDTICQYMPVSPEFLRGFTATHLALQGSEMVHQRHTQMAPWRRKPVAVCQNWGSRPLADKNSSARTFIRASANRNSCALFQSVPLQ